MSSANKLINDRPRQDLDTACFAAIIEEQE